MPIDKIIPQYLNKDDDERIIKSVEMTDALNISVSSEGSGASTVVKNVKGNTQVPPKSSSDQIPTTGYNRVIGSVATQAGDSIFYFLYNSDGRHGIYRYSYGDNAYIKLYESSHLNFHRKSFVKADLIINQFGEYLLYFTDDVNEPRKINATKLEFNQYDQLINTGTDEEKELFFTVAKRPPTYPPTFEFQTNATLRANHLKENLFQFAYQYIYDDGEITALSPYSALAVSPTNLAYDSLSRDAFTTENNEVEVTVLNSAGPVRKIRVFARRNNDGKFFRIKELDNIPEAVSQSFAFRNDGNYVFLSEEESNKLFDSVPRQSKTQTISNNRLLYGNYLEGFDNIETNVFGYPVYHREDEVPNADIEISPLATQDIAEDLANIFYQNVYELANDHPAWTYLWNQRRKRPFGQPPPLNTWGDVAIYGVGDGPGFNIDMSQYSETGYSSDIRMVVSAIVGCSRFGIGTTTSSTNINQQHARNMRFPVVVSRYKNENLVHQEELFICTPSAPYTNNDGDFYNYNLDGYGNINYHGYNYRSLVLYPKGDMEFTREILIPANTTRAEAIQIIGEQMLGLESFAQVNNGDAGDGYNFRVFQGGFMQQVWSEDAEGIVGVENQPLIEYRTNTTQDNYNLSCVASPQQTYGVGGEINVVNNVFLYLGGSVYSSIESYQVTGDTVRFNLRMSGVELTSYRGFISGGQIPPLPVTINQFHTPDENDTFVLLGPQDVDASINRDVTNGNGMTLSDQINGDASVRTAWVGFKSYGSATILPSGSDRSKSFKAGAVHDVGVVYFDHRMRAGGVQAIDGEISVAHFSEEPRGGNNGRTEIDLRVMHEPPYWAKYWAPVYTKNLTYERFAHFTVAEAALGNENIYAEILSPGGGDRPIIQALEDTDRGAIFLSLRGLEGKNDSYKEFKGGDLKYSFVEGDKIRVLQYMDQAGNTIRPLHEFVVTGLHYFQDDDKNPIQLSSTGSGPDDNYRRTGWFLAIRSEDIPGFSKEDVSTGVDFFSQKCLIEIFSPKKNTDAKTYYEIGQVYPVVETQLGRTHGGDRSNDAIQDFEITPVSEYSFISSQRLYLGDRIINTPNNDGYAFVFGISPQGNDSYFYSINPFPTQAFDEDELGQPVQGINVAQSGNNGLFPGVVTLRNGDVYMRLREQLVNPESNDYTAAGQTFKNNPTLPKQQDYDVFLIEDSRVSDFFPSDATAIGRPHIETPDQKEIRRHSSVTYSDPYAADSSVLSLSSFNPSLFPYKDYNTKHGGITYLHDGGEVVYVLQEHKVCQQTINRQLIEHAAGGMLVTSQNVLGVENYFAGDFGPGKNPEGVVAAMGRIYFPSKHTGKVVQIGASGIELISQKGMDDFFMDELPALSSDYKIPCGYDPDKDQFIISWSNYFLDEPLVEEPTTTTGGGSAPGPVDTEPVIATELPAIEVMTEDRNSVEFSDEVFDESELVVDQDSDAVVYIDKIKDSNPVYISREKTSSSTGLQATIKKADGTIVGYATVYPAAGQMLLPESIATQYGIETAAPAVPPVYVPPVLDGDPEIYIPPTTPTPDGELVVVEYYGNTAAYEAMDGVWLTLYSFIPELYSWLNDRMFTFQNGNLYLHNSNDIRSNFYGVQYPAVVEVVSKHNPSMIKSFHALSIESRHPWPTIISTEDQETSIPSYKFIDREGLQYSDIPRNFNDGSTSNKITLGVVAVVSGQEIVFLNRISDAPFQLGAQIYNSDGDALGITATQVSGRKSLLVTGDTSAIQQGDVLVVGSDPYYSGDRMRDYYVKIRMINASGENRELYAVNTVFETSTLHNEQVN